MMQAGILFGMLLLLTSNCQPEFTSKNPFTYHQKPQKFFDQFVNQAATPKSLENKQLIRLKNESFPLELTLFKDKGFYYHMETLGDGFGTWEFQEDGKLHLYAERTLFVMHMNIHSIDPSSNELAIDFIDRFGTQYLHLDVDPGGIN